MPMKKKQVTIGAITIKPTSGNKTGAWRLVEPLISDKCIACGICVQVCPEGCIVLAEKGGKKKAVVDYDYCKGCMICATQCPVKAIEKKGVKK